jgi:hypothetical protein
MAARSVPPNGAVETFASIAGCVQALGSGCRPVVSIGTLGPWVGFGAGDKSLRVRMSGSEFREIAFCVARLGSTVIDGRKPRANSSHYDAMRFI